MPKKFNEHFYFEDAIEMEHYTDTPSDLLSVPRLMQQKTHWKTSVEHTSLKKKTLVVYSESDICWSEIEAIVLVERLIELQQAGFSIYTYNEDGFQIFKTANLDDTPNSYENLFQLGFIPQESTLHQEAIAFLGLSHDAIALLNDEKLRQLIKGGREDWEHLESFETVDLHHSNISLDSFIQLLEEKGAEIRHLNIAGCLNLTGEGFPHHVPLEQLETLILGDQAGRELTVFHDFYLKECQELTKSTTLCKQGIQTLLTTPQHLRVLELYADLTYVDHDVINTFIPSHSLKSLRYHAGNMTSDQMSALLTQSKNLETLQTGLTSIETLPDAIVCNALETLDITIASSQHMHKIVLILAKTPNLKTLHLSCPHQPDEIEIHREAHRIISPIKLPHLNQFKYINTTPIKYEYRQKQSPQPVSSILDILTNATALKTLHIQGYDLENSLQKIGPMPVLESLTLTDVQMNLAKLQHLLNTTTQLKILNLRPTHHGLKNSFVNVTIEDSILFDLPHLTQCHLERFNIQRVSHLLSKLHHLCELRLILCDLDNQLPENLSFPHLVHVNLSYSTIYDSSLEQLLQESSGLKTLTLSGTEIKSSGISLKKVPFDTLETLVLSATLLSHEILFNWLSVQNLLTTLKIEDCDFNDQPLSNEKNSKLPSLKTLHIEHNELKLAPINSLIKYADHLQELKLIRCEFMDSLEKLAPLTHLTQYSLIETKIGGCLWIEWLSTMTSLRSLTLSSVYFMRDNKLNEYVSPPLKHLTQFTLHDNDSLSEEALIVLLKTMTHLKALNITQCTISKEEEDDQDENKMEPYHTSGLHHLSLSKTILSDQIMWGLFSPIKQLHTLNLEGHPNIPDMATQLTKINSLTLSCKHIDKTTFQKLQSLQTLTIKFTVNETKKNDAIIQVDSDPIHCLQSLDQLEITGATCQDKELSTLLLKTKQLQTLQILRSTIMGDYLSDLINLDTLRSLQVLHSTVSAQWIEKIKNKASPELIINIVEKPDQYQEPNPLLNADTNYNPDKAFVVNRLFWAPAGQKHPSPSQYRLKTYHQVHVNPTTCTTNNAFRLLSEHPNPIVLVPEIERVELDVYDRLSTYSPTEHYYYGKQALTLSTEHWTSLPSISPNENLICYHLNSPINIVFGRCDRSGFFYIRPTDESTSRTHVVSIDFIVWVPPKKHILQIMHPAAPLLYKLSNTIHGFGIGPLNLEGTTNPTGRDYWAALCQQKLGSCRHRSLVYLLSAQQYIKKSPQLFSRIDVRIVNNDCHSFIEVYFGDEWYTFDLGGYPAQLTINSDNTPKHLVAEDESHPHLEELKSAMDVSTIDYFPLEITISKPDSINTYIESRLSDSHRSHLLKLDDTNAINSLRYAIQKICHTTDRRCFYAHTAEDLICSASFITCLDNHEGLSKKGPGGRLHAFLEQCADDPLPPLLIINYDQFSRKEIIQLNGILDEHPHADGTPLPARLKIIALMNPKKAGAYQGADFYSRFDHIEQVPFKAYELPHPPVYLSHSREASPTPEIELFDGLDWEERLLGHWRLNNQQLTFVKGALILAIDEGATHLHLKNPPKNDVAFDLFWQQAFLYGQIHYFGQVKSFPTHLSLSTSQGYDFKRFQSRITLNEQPEIPKNALTLNQYRLSHYLGDYLFNEATESISYAPGLLAKYHGQTLAVYLSHALSTKQWFLWLDACEKESVAIELSVAPNIALPKGLLLLSPEHKKQAVPEPWPPEPGTLLPPDLYICSTDIGATLAEIADEHTKVIDVSELEPSDFFTQLTARFDEENQRFIFSKQEGILEDLLQQDLTLVLTGFFEDSLDQKLTEFLLERQQAESKRGRLCLISQQKNLFSLIPNYQHHVGIQDKKRLLDRLRSLPSITDQTLLAQHTFYELMAMRHYLTDHPNGHPLHAWMGMESLPYDATQDLIDLTDAVAKAEAFHQARCHAVFERLQSSPYVFLAGMTGVGKTSFVHRIWKDHIRGHLFIGEHAMETWATQPDDGSGWITLFIDEANATQSQWSRFEGLMHPSRCLLINKQLITLSPNHKIIFAGNPVSYGAGRQLPSLFQHHGHSLVFQPLPPACIYQDILKPVLEPLLTKYPNLTTETVAIPFLEIAAFLTHCSQDKVLVTPRQLTTMAMLTFMQSMTNPVDPLLAARYYAYFIAKERVPEHKCELFNKQFCPTALPRATVTPDQLLINHHNEPAFHALSDFISLRSFRRTHVEELNPTQCLGGLGGLVIEGEPGVGKTELVIRTLLLNGLRKANRQDTPLEGDWFYHIPVSMSLPAKIELLHKAFHEGAVIVIDEINSAPMIERLMNDLLMGQTPEGHGPNKVGFLVIGTQNPSTMAGRAQTSQAIENRMHRVVIPHYTREQMIEILHYEGLPESISTELVNQYLTRREKTGQTPELCFRDVLKCAKRILKTLPPAEKSIAEPIQDHQTRAINFFKEPAFHSKRSRRDDVAIAEEASTADPRM